MNEFYVMTENGTRPPRYMHVSIESAVTEAKRLAALYKTPVHILEIVGSVRPVEVPVTRTEILTNLSFINRGDAQDDDLPF